MRIHAILFFSLALGLGSSQAGAFARDGVPFRCYDVLDASEQEQNIPLTCELLDGTPLTQVPEGQYLFVTDVKITRRLGSQSNFLADIRIWRMDAGGGLLDFVNNYVYRIDYALSPDGVRESYQMPFLVLRPGERLHSFHYGSSGGHIIWVSGVMTDSLVGRVELFRDSFEAGFVAPAIAALPA